MSRYLIEIENIKKNFYHKKNLIKVFQNVTFKIKPGELVALIGPSGSGKSSLLNLLALIDTPTSGKIIFKDKDSKNFKDEEKNKIRQTKISMIFQNNNLLSDFTAIENVIMPLIIRKESYSDSVVKAKKVLKKVKLENRHDHFPNELSGGEQQRVAIARTLISKTELILADEPTGNLDYRNSNDIFSYFLKLKKLNKAIIFATHNRELANKADYKLSISNCNIKRLNV
jgi:ABC-type lipoprotein export system ATPase subunit|tara:strand:+ start:378 stop:1061 length:684 start_codon:yes stop_codon:yes gene_type:complete